MKIAIAGIGYVGLSLGVALAEHNEVIMIDPNANKVNMLNAGTSPISDPQIFSLLNSKTLDIQATTDVSSYLGAGLIVVAVPTNYSDENGAFDTSCIEDVLAATKIYASETPILIKSTLPVGYIDKVLSSDPKRIIVYSPEFLREAHSLEDTLNPTRIVLGYDRSNSAAENAASLILKLLQECLIDKNVPILRMAPAEAEAVKLFSNTYLAMRVAFFNELDTYAMEKGLNTKSIIDGVSLDPRIQNFYNNPSFGYGGYCLPKDTKQLLSNFSDVPGTLLKAIVDSNAERKHYLTEKIKAILGKDYQRKTVGIYRLTMKTASDNFRSSSIQDVMRSLAASGIKILIYEPLVGSDEFEGYSVTKDLQAFKDSSDLIIANRVTADLDDVSEKLFSRDVFSRD